MRLAEDEVSTEEEWAEAPLAPFTKDNANRALEERCAYRRLLQTKPGMCSQRWLSDWEVEAEDVSWYYLQDRGAIFF